MESELRLPNDRPFTVGHSNHEPEVLLGLLRGSGVTAVADVRSSPYSRRQPHFSRGPLEAWLAVSLVFC